MLTSSYLMRSDHEHLPCKFCTCCRTTPTSIFSPLWTSLLTSCGGQTLLMRRGISHSPRLCAALVGTVRLTSEFDSALKPAELQVLRSQYEKEGEYVSLQTKFNYAWVDLPYHHTTTSSLTRSRVYTGPNQILFPPRTTRRRAPALRNLPPES